MSHFGEELATVSLPLIFFIFVFLSDEFRNQGRNSDTFEDFFDLLKTLQSPAESNWVVQF